ncbi:hypothetical protein E3O62_11910 [Cryobacterium sp. TMT2-15-1]|uniref:hypothetical protein n=1 Tax=Cryobacterium sp. TMT2-15-1 TaxID=1259246 RepID=UPI001069D6E9|nr:hypothetical protein [Cryobacterium sp. TMT2-15-1]TFC56879.1 hypothetical protein E3O62_11910 [Cryobacterium sp. TMT2-15-1]
MADREAQPLLPADAFIHDVARLMRPVGLLDGDRHAAFLEAHSKALVPFGEVDPPCGVGGGGIEHPPIGNPRQ